MCTSNMYLWQSRVEIEHYSATYFDCITTFEVLKYRTSVTGKAYMHCVVVLFWLTITLTKYILVWLFYNLVNQTITKSFAKLGTITKLKYPRTYKKKL